MATGPQDTGHNPNNDIQQDAPDRPETVARSIAWPDSAGMAAQQSAANQMFRQNSERMQQPTTEKDDVADPSPPQTPDEQELTIVKDQGRGNYAGFKVEQAKAAVEQDAPDLGNQPESDSQELTIVKDQGRGNYAGLKAEQAKASDNELTIVKNRNPRLDLSR